MSLHQVVKNISYSFGANIVSLGVFVLMVMFVPKLLSVENYGKWWLFLFYFSYLGFCILVGKMVFIYAMQTKGSE